MEFLKDDGLSFCSFFDIKVINNDKKDLKNEEKDKAVHLTSIKENEKIMILYSKESRQKTFA